MGSGRGQAAISTRRVFAKRLPPQIEFGSALPSLMELFEYPIGHLGFKGFSSALFLLFLLFKNMPLQFSSSLFLSCTESVFLMKHRSFF